jgi:hypothetical protein
VVLHVKNAVQNVEYVGSKTPDLLKALIGWLAIVASALENS